MARINIDTSKGNFIFETVMSVRHNEIDVGELITIDSLTALLIEARARFFFSRGIKDINDEFHALIANDIIINIVRRARVRQKLLFEVGVSNLARDGGELLIKVSSMYDNAVVAKALINFVNYDYRANEITPMSPSVIQALDVRS